MKTLQDEGRIQAFLQIENIEFCITGNYDRIDYLRGGLEVIQYKSDRNLKLPEPDELDFQIGLYSLALEQTYQQKLRYLSFLFLRTGEKIRFRANSYHKKQAQAMLSGLANQFRCLTTPLEIRIKSVDGAKQF